MTLRQSTQDDYLEDLPTGNSVSRLSDDEDEISTPSLGARRCVDCGQPIPDGSKYCPSCGREQ